jgi:hypothetical protein
MIGKKTTSSARAVTTRNDGSHPPGWEATAASHEVREHKIGKIIIKIVGGIITLFGLVLAVSTNSSGRSAESYLLGSGTPTCADPKWLLQVPDSQIAVTAFYYHRPYSADLTKDGDQATAWLQWWPTTDFGGYKPGDNYIRWDFSPVQYNLRLICIADGWNRDILAWSATEPIRRATINLESNGCPVYEKKFSNKGFMGGFPAEWQQVRVLCRTSVVRLVVDSTYNAATPLCVPLPSSIGITGCRPLTGMSEVRFYYSPDVLEWVGWSARTKQLLQKILRAIWSCARDPRSGSYSPGYLVLRLTSKSPDGGGCFSRRRSRPTALLYFCAVRHFDLVVMRHDPMPGPSLIFTGYA